MCGETVLPSTLPLRLWRLSKVLALAVRLAHGLLAVLGRVRLAL
jgi:hypothetical protein